MKKIITLLLVLTGVVQMASATEYSVYFQPNNDWKKFSATFALYMYNSTENHWEAFSETTTSGVYKATYDDTYNTNIIIVRLCPSGSEGYSGDNGGLNWTNKWNQTSNIACPSTNVFYYNLNGSGDTYTVSAMEQPTSCVVAASAEVTNDYENFNATSTVNQMSLEGDGMTYKLNVSNHVVPAEGEKNYRFKIVENGTDWYPASDVTMENLDNDGIYNISYTWNWCTQSASYSVSKVSDATISYKYFLKEYIDENYVDRGELENVSTGDNANKFAVKTINRTVEDDAIIKFKILKQSIATPTEGDAVIAKEIWWGLDDTSVDELYNDKVEIERGGTYDINFNVWYGDSRTLYDTSSESKWQNATNAESFTAYHIAGASGSDTWKAGDAFTEIDGTYSIVLENKAGYYFAIIPNNAINADYTIADWSQVLNPDKQDYDIDITWTINQTGNNVHLHGDGDKCWHIVSSYAGKVKFTYTPATNTWSAEPYIERDLKAGYATFSADYNVAIPDGITAYYATEASVGKVKMTSISDGISSAKGAFLSVPTTKTYAFTPAESVDEGDNLLVKGTATGVPATDEANNLFRYVYAKQGGETGFFNVATAVSQDMTGKAYLETATSIKPVSGARVAIIFDGEGETTGIKQVETAKQSVEGYYNLAGQRVAQPTKGLYIVNGKKVIMK